MLSDAIKTLRKHNYLNQTEFARKLGVAQATVSQWENNITRPNSEQLKTISAVFKISIDDLLSSDNVLESPPATISPRTTEAKILAKGIDRLPREQREQALNVVKAMFTQYSDYFEKGDDL